MTYAETKLSQQAVQLDAPMCFVWVLSMSWDASLV